MTPQDFSNRTPTRLDGELATYFVFSHNPPENKTASYIKITMPKKKIMKTKSCEYFYFRSDSVHWEILNR